VGKKPQPGQYSGNMYNDIALDDITNAAISDRRIKKPNFWNKLGFGKNGYYSVYLVIDEGNDYHWYRQDKGGLWSQKHGWGTVTNIDGSGKFIYNVVRANHNYGVGINYNDGGRLLWVRRR
jgi:hypothetical protein